MAVTDLSERFARHAAAAGLFPQPGGALVAVSGGVDSVVLLDLMTQVAARFKLDPTVAHVDHGIRSNSGEVAASVRALASRYGVDYVQASLGLGPGTTETEARLERYRALRRLQREGGARYLVTAHQADDQVETVLFRFLRGSGVAGLAGMPELGRGGLTRPLLPFTRAEVEAWASARALPYDADPSNADPKHDRSWLRTVLLPMLRTRFGSGVDRHVLAVAADAGRNRTAWSALLPAVPDLLLELGDTHVEVARVSLAQYHNMLSQALLRACALEVGCRVGAAQTARLLDFAINGQSGRVMDLGSGWRAELVFDRLRIDRLAARDEQVPVCRLAGDRGEAVFGAWRIRWRMSPAGPIERRGHVTWFPQGDLVVRQWRPGDRLVPLGGIGSRKVRRLLMEGRVPRQARVTYPVVELAGRVVWLPGLCRGADAIPSVGAEACEVAAVEQGTGAPEPDTRERVAG